MCDTLKQLYKVFEAACQGQEKVSLKLSRFFYNFFFWLLISPKYIDG